MLPNHMRCRHGNMMLIFHSCGSLLFTRTTIAVGYQLQCLGWGIVKGWHGGINTKSHCLF